MAKRVFGLADGFRYLTCIAENLMMIGEYVIWQDFS